MEQLQQALSTPPPNWQPPPGAPTNPITILHASLEHLRNTGDEQYLFFRATLELLTKHGFLGAESAAANHPTPLSGDEEQLLFHCVTGIRHVMLCRWGEYFQPSFRACVRDFLLAIGLGCFNNRTTTVNNAVLPRTFTLACLSSAASFWKRAWTGGSDDNVVQQDSQQNYLESLITTNLMPSMQRFNGTDGQELFAYLSSLLTSPFEQLLHPMELMRRQYTGSMTASFLSLLIGEFSGGNTSARYNLPIEFHRLCHQVFENGNEEAVLSGNGSNGSKSGLDTTLQLSMSALSSFVGLMLNTESDSEAINDESLLNLGISSVILTFDVLSWEFGASSSKWDFSNGSSKKDGGSVLLRPPHRWREALINPEFLGAMFRVYNAVRVSSYDTLLRSVKEKRGRMAHQLRQLLLQLSSIASGPIFADESERGAYAGFLLDGCLDALETILRDNQQRGQSIEETDFLSSEVIDLATMLSRLATNFGVKTLSHLASFQRFLSAIAMVGKWLLECCLAECERVEGDIESMEGLEWKYDAMTQILQCSEAMADDYWLVSGDAQIASENLAKILAPLFAPYVNCRVRMSSLEEHFLTQQGEELDEIREEIWAFGLEEEMASAASLGRLNIPVSLETLSSMFQQCVPRLMSLFEATGNGSEMTPAMAALLEETRMLILCACHLLTDECEGETPSIPDAVIHACQPGRTSGHDSCLTSIMRLIELLRSIAEAQAMKVSAYPNESSLSPLLAKTLLLFFRRWSAAYVLPVSADYHKEGIFVKWSTPENASPIISFCTTLSLIYFCHWPQEKEVQDESTALLLVLAKKGLFVRQLMVDSPSFEHIAALHSICSSLRHNASQAEIVTSMSSFVGIVSVEAVRGYQRLPYMDRARVLTCLVVGCSDMENEKSNAMLDGCLKAVANHFFALVEALSNKQANANDMNVQESACLSILLYSGIVCGSEMSEPERIPHFITPYLPHLSGLMTYYAEDLTICEALLNLFRDYAERYLAMLSRDQCISLFTSSASLLKLYSEHHCKHRVIHKRPEALEGVFEEERSYKDILCAIQLLIHLGTKDFTDICNSSKGVQTSQITDVIFFGLQQIIPLMTQGLLHYPTLCQMYFSLVGFMVETYPEKLCYLPFELFNSLLDSLLFGMSHSDSLVSKSSLQGLASLAKEHLKTHALASHLAIKSDIIENCSQRLIQEVIFQPIIWDRIEPSGMALLPLAAIDVQKFIGLVNLISQQLGSDDKQQRMHRAFERLIKPQILVKVAADGREGRMVRIQFKNNFDVFVRDVHSFLITK